MSSDAAAGAPLPRLCCLEKGPNGYGFHLHGEKGKVGQFIRLVEPGSPAERAGLLAGDRLVEVNGENVEKETHQQVVSRIRAALNAVRLLVVDPETDERLQKLGVQVREEMLRVQEGPTQAEPPAAAETQEAGGENEPQAAAQEPREAEKSRSERVSAGWAGRRGWNGVGGKDRGETQAPRARLVFLKLDPRGGDCFRPPTGLTGSYRLGAASHDPHPLSRLAWTLSFFATCTSCPLAFGSEGREGDSGKSSPGFLGSIGGVCSRFFANPLIPPSPGRFLGSPTSSRPIVASFLHGPCGW